METTVGERLLLLLDKKGMTQADLSRKTGRSKASISDVISGRRNMGLEFALDIAKAVDMPPVDFLVFMSMLPPQTPKDVILNQIDYIYGTLEDPGNKQKTLEYIEFLKTQEEKGNYNAGQNTKTEPR